MNSPSSLKAMMCGILRRSSSWERPSIAALSTMFWRPVNSGWNPDPSSRMEAILPPTAKAPAEGAVMPARIFSSVLLPAPFSPISASPSPRGNAKLTSSRAWNSRCLRRRVIPSSRRSQGVAYDL